MPGLMVANIVFFSNYYITIICHKLDIPSIQINIYLCIYIQIYLRVNKFEKSWYKNCMFINTYLYLNTKKSIKYNN